MSVKIKYLNDFGSTITAEQKNLLTNYSKITMIDGFVKIQEEFITTRKSNYKKVHYFLDNTEEKNIVLQQYTDKTNNSKCILYFNKQTANTYSLWDWESYSSDSVLSFKGKMTFDSNHKMVFVCTLDLNNNQIQGGAWKNYYGNQFENELDDILLRFFYDSTGSVDSVVDVNEKYGYAEPLTLDEFLADTQFSQVDFPWTQHPYYHSVLPYLPTGGL